MGLSPSAPRRTQKSVQAPECRTARPRWLNVRVPAMTKNNRQGAAEVLPLTTVGFRSRLEWFAGSTVLALVPQASGL